MKNKVAFEMEACECISDKLVQQDAEIQYYVLVMLEISMRILKYNNLEVMQVERRSYSSTMP
jgi:hypothetical protein